MTEQSEVLSFVFPVVSADSKSFFSECFIFMFSLPNHVAVQKFCTVERKKLNLTLKTIMLHNNLNASVKIIRCLPRTTSLSPLYFQDSQAFKLLKFMKI